MSIITAYSTKFRLREKISNDQRALENMESVYKSLEDIKLVLKLSAVPQFSSAHIFDKVLSLVKVHNIKSISP